MIMNPFSSSSSSVSLLVFITITLLSSLVTFTLSSVGFENYLQLSLPNGVSGPESLAFDCDGEGPYTGVSDGRILKWKGTHQGWVEFAVNSPHRDRKLCDGSTDPENDHLCGRPLGVKFDYKTCNLYFADSYLGIFMVGPNGGVAKQLANSTDDGVPFKFLNGLDVDGQTGVVYFSESSTVYGPGEFSKIIETGDRSGRLLKYDPVSKKVQVLLKGLALANGVALSQDSSFLLLAESTSNKIHKVWLKGSKAYTSELFAQLERSPDNIKRNKMGKFWVALNYDTTKLQSADNNARLQSQALALWRKEEYPVGIKFDEKGNILEVLDGNGRPEISSTSEVEEYNGRLWLGSTVKSYVVVLGKTLFKKLSLEVTF